MKNSLVRDVVTNYVNNWSVVVNIRPPKDFRRDRLMPLHRQQRDARQTRIYAKPMGKVAVRLAEERAIKSARVNFAALRRARFV